MASAGEFTMRAFKNGRLDLSQAESVADLIASESSAAHKTALKQLKGDFKDRLETLKSEFSDNIEARDLSCDAAHYIWDIIEKSCMFRT